MFFSAQLSFTFGVYCLHIVLSLSLIDVHAPANWTMAEWYNHCARSILTRVQYPTNIFFSRLLILRCLPLFFLFFWSTPPPASAALLIAQYPLSLPVFPGRGVRRGGGGVVGGLSYII